MQGWIVTIDEDLHRRCRREVERAFPDVDLQDEPVRERCDDKMRGCYESHIARYRAWLSRPGNDPWSVVFEEDLVVPGPSTRIDTWVAAVRAVDPDFDVLYLGHRFVWEQQTSFHRVAPNLLRVRTNDLHAYVLSRRFATHMVENHGTFAGDAIDVIVREEAHRAYAVTPMLAYQRGLNGLAQRGATLMLWPGELFATYRRRAWWVAGVTLGTLVAWAFVG